MTEATPSEARTEEHAAAAEPEPGGGGAAAGIPVGPITPAPVDEPHKGAGRRQEPFAGAFLTLQQLYAQQDPDNWIIDNLFCRGELLMVVGDSGTGKSYLVLDMLFAIATGESWAGGRFAIPRRQLCIYSYGEGRRGIRKRTIARHNHYREGGGEEEPALLMLPVIPQLFDSTAPDGAEAFIRECQRVTAGQEVGVVVIDTLNRASRGGDENSTPDSTLMLAHAERIQQETGAAVLIVHHVNKTGSYRGNTTLRGAMDGMLEVRRVADNEHILHCDKLRDGEIFDDLGFHFISYEQSAVLAWDGPSRERQGDSINSEIVAVLEGAGEEWLTAKQIGESIDQPSPNVIRALQGALRSQINFRLEDSTRAASNRNPKVYQLKQIWSPYKEE